MGALGGVAALDGFVLGGAIAVTNEAILDNLDNSKGASDSQSDSKGCNDDGPEPLPGSSGPDPSSVPSPSVADLANVFGGGVLTGCVTGLLLPVSAPLSPVATNLALSQGFGGLALGLASPGGINLDLF